MILGWSTASFTLLHVILSLIAFGSGLVVAVGIWRQKGSTAGRRCFWRQRC